MAEVLEGLGISRDGYYRRLKRGWSRERALIEPNQVSRR